MFGQGCGGGTFRTLGAVTTSAMYRWRRRLADWIDPDAPAAAPRRGSSGRTALVIAGGGARASFEIGALQYLYERERIRPEIISGTSAGSIIAAMVAQHADPKAQAEALNRLEAIWVGMQHSSDMFAEQPWFTALRSHIPTWRKVMALRQRQANRASLAASLTDLLAKPREAVARIAGDRPSAERPEHPPERRPPHAAVEPHDEPAAPGTGEPPREHAAGDRTPPEQARTWTPTHAFEALATLWEAGRSSTDLDFIVQGAQQERSAFKPGRIVEDLLDPDTFQAARVSASGVQLRVAVVSLESGELRYVDERGRLRDRQDRVLNDLEPVDLVQAILASCSIPGVFPPVRLAREHYVDGGMRENVPAEIVLEHQEVDRCYVVVAAPDGVPATSDFTDKDLMEIVMRSTAAVMPDELQRDEVRLARARGAVVIQPELDIHDAITIDPGLSAIAIDYGYLRAADVCEDAGPQRQARTRDVIQLRRLIWSTEDALFGRHAPGSEDPDPDVPERDVDLGELVELKLRLRDLVADPGSAHLPPEAQTWWRTWERHPFAIEVEPSWDGAYVR